VVRVFGFGEHAKADVRLETAKIKEACSCISARVFGDEVSYKLGAPGRHLVQNSLAVLGAVSLLGADLAKAALALATLSAGKGRGERHTLRLPHGTALLIDESYNANPASMRATIALLGQSVPEKGGRRVAVLGDMRELGGNAAALHAELADALVAAKVDTVYLAGPLMQALWEAIPGAMRGAHAESAADLEPQLFAALGPGDVIMVKGSNASRMGPLVEALKKKFPPARAAADDMQEQETA
jgi:UDP-N-acetylmuramoyl-tripeptide--D-alanyl-D-alanine ligase